jgi:hypothetical protein
VELKAEAMPGLDMEDLGGIAVAPGPEQLVAPRLRRFLGELPSVPGASRVSGERAGARRERIKGRSEAPPGILSLLSAGYHENLSGRSTPEN